MKALSIIQPWATLIAFGVKDIENRTWPTRFRGRFAIHASKGFDSAALEMLRHSEFAPRIDFNPKNYVRGAIIGVGDIVGCVTESESEWFSGPFGFLIQFPRALIVDQPCKGSLGFWTVPADIAAEIEHQLK